MPVGWPDESLRIADRPVIGAPVRGPPRNAFFSQSSRTVCSRSVGFESLSLTRSIASFAASIATPGSCSADGGRAAAIVSTESRSMRCQPRSGSTSTRSGFAGVPSALRGTASTITDEAAPADSSTGVSSMAFIVAGSNENATSCHSSAGDSIGTVALALSRSPPASSWIARPASLHSYRGRVAAACPSLLNARTNTGFGSAGGF